MLRSALVVAIPDVASLVDPWRERTCEAKPSAGIPPHVTILFPFAPAAELDDRLVAELRTLCGRVRPFAFALRRTERFPGVLYLAPEPNEPFVLLTRTLVAAYPQYPPYGGAFDDPIPHLTVAQGDDAVLAAANTDVAPRLPFSGRAEAVALLEEEVPDFGRWRERARLPFAAS